MKKKIAAILAVTLGTGLLAGCGRINVTGRAGQDEEALMQASKGAFVEKQLSFPEGTESSDAVQILAGKDGLQLITRQITGENTCTYRQWSLEGERFTEVTKDWLKGLELPFTSYGAVRLLEDSTGNQYLYSIYTEGEEEVEGGHLFKETDGQAEEITPKEWVEEDQQWGFCNSAQDVALIDDTVIVARTYTGTEQLTAEDGAIYAADDEGSGYLSQVLSGEKGYYLGAMDNMGKLTELDFYELGGNSPAWSVPVAQESSVTSYIAADQNGNVIYGNGDGFFRLTEDRKGWEKLIEGVDTYMSLSDVWCKGLVLVDNGDFYALYGSSADGNVMMQYTYDPEAVREIKTVLHVYTVNENYLLQQAAAAYHKEHPEVMVKVEAEVSLEEYYSGTADYQQIYQKLNTRLLSGDAPDLMIMDGLNMDSFIKKGLLENIDFLVRPLEEDGTLLANITGNYVREDGSRYVVPLQFSLMLAVGREGVDTEATKDLKSLAEYLSTQSESLMGDRTPYELAETFLPYFAQEVIRDNGNEKELDTQALSRNLEYIRQIAQNCGVIEKRGKDERALSIWDIASKAKLALTKTSGFNDAMLPVSAANLVKGSFEPFGNAFFPSIQAGIYAKSSQAEEVEKFLSFLLSETVQSVDYYQGFPVNVGSLETLARKDRGDAVAYTTIDMGDGVEGDFCIENFSEETAGRLIAACKQVQNRAMTDDVITNAIAEALPDYLSGASSLEATVQKIDAATNTYLAE